jgi:uncharacterized protein YegL
MHCKLKPLALVPTLFAALITAQGFQLGPQESRPAPQSAPQSFPQRPLPVPFPPPFPQRGPMVRLLSQRVRATLTDGVADTTTEQVFRNDGGTDAEVDFLFPLPPDAAADRFTMTMNGKDVPAEVLDANRARTVYEEIVAKRRDPGLLEYVGHGLLRARIFPVAPGAENRVTLRYRAVLPQSGGLHEFTFPLRATGASQMVPDQLVLDVDIQSSKGVRNVYTQLPGAEVRIVNDRSARVTFECRGRIPDRDLKVFHSFTDAEFGVSLLSYRRRGADGWFLMMVSPKREAVAEKPFPKTVSFVVDTSGSMAGKKMEQAKAALKFFLEQLKPGDAFNIVPFSTEARPVFPGPVEANRANLDKALGDVAALEARGGTNIGDGLDRVLGAGAWDGRTRMIVFLTDGLPTVGTTDADTLLAEVRRKNAAGDRIFVFGVGSDVNTRLLDTMAEESRGARDYVTESESIEVKVGSLLTKLASPAMTDVEILCDGITGYDLMPRKTPDLFRGDRLLVFGRYKGEGMAKVRLRGKVAGEAREFVYDTQFPEQAEGNDFLPAIWAQRRVAFLLDEIRLKGRNPELVDEVTRLGREHSIVTPFTSHLILEDGVKLATVRTAAVTPGQQPSPVDAMRAEHERARAGLPASEAKKRESDPQGPATAGPGGAASPFGATAGGGRAATPEASKAAMEGLDKDLAGDAGVARSLYLLRLKADDRGGDARELGRVASRRVKDRTFFLIDGVWIDGRLTAELAKTTRKVAAYSKEYFEALRTQPELAVCFALGERVAVVVGGGVIEVE